MVSKETIKLPGELTVKNIAILSLGASGTNALFNELLKNTQILNHPFKEPFHNKLGTLEKRLLHHNREFHQVIDTLLWSAKRKKLVIHIKPQHLKQANVGIREFITQYNDSFDFVRIERKNYLARVVSSEFKSLRKTLSPSEFESLGKVRLQTEKGKILWKMHEIKSKNESIAKPLQSLDHLFFDYEKDINQERGPETVSNIICERHGISGSNSRRLVQRENYHGRKNKWSEIKLEQKIENFDEVMADFTGTEYEWMLWE